MNANEYLAIRFWGSEGNTSQHYTMQQMDRAAKDNAPELAIYERDGVWRTLDNVKNLQIVKECKKNHPDLAEKAGFNKETHFSNRGPELVKAVRVITTVLDALDVDYFEMTVNARNALITPTDPEHRGFIVTACDIAGIQRSILTTGIQIFAASYT